MKKIKSLRLSVISTLFLLLTFLITSLAIYQTFKLVRNIEDQIQLEELSKLEEISLQIYERNSNYLSQQATLYSITNKFIYYQNYWTQYDEFQTKYISLTAVDNLDLTHTELDNWDSLNSNYALMKDIELHSMVLVALGTGLNQSEWASSMLEYELSSIEYSLTSEEQLELANTYLFSKAYLEASTQLSDKMNVLSDAIRTRVRENLSDAGDNTLNTINLQRLLFFQQIFLISILFIFLFNNIVMPLRNYVSSLSEQNYLIPKGSAELRVLAEAFNTHMANVSFNEKRFKTAASTITDIILEYDFTSGKLICLTDLPFHDSPGNCLCNASLDAWMEMIHPDDLDSISKLYSSFGTNETTTSVSIRIKNLEFKTSEYKWYLTTLSELHNSYTNDKKILITLKDIDLDYKNALGLRYKAEHDQLTGLYNRATFEALVTHSLSAEHLESAVLLLFDFDDFKNINDSMGHSLGDEALKLLAKVLKQSFRDSDVIGRLGGDEFGVFMKAIPQNQEFLTEKLKNLNQLLNQEPDENFINTNLSTSIGVSFMKEGDDFLSLFNRSDAALYESKRNGKNQFSFN